MRAAGEIHGTVISYPDVDLEHLLKLRVVVARVGEMDLAKWWNTNGQLGRYGDAAVRRGLPRTHYFAQARSVAAVAAHRCDEVFSLANTVTLWRLPASVEERYEARWEHWLDNAADWTAFFASVAALDDARSRGGAAGVRPCRARRASRQFATWRPGPAAGRCHSWHLHRTRADLEMLALGFSRGAVGLAHRPVRQARGQLTLADRADVVSSFTVIKGTMIEETYAVFERWDLQASKRENLDRLREENYIGASSATWLRDVAKVINRRYDPGRPRPRTGRPGAGRLPARRVAPDRCSGT